MRTLPRLRLRLAPTALGSVMLVCSFPLTAQTSTPPARAATTTASGVYTDEQAIRGRDVYLGNCKSCHTPESHAGPVFRQTWHGQRLSALFAYISLQMPKNEPGTLSAQENADVVAYLLKLNRAPPGSVEVAPDSTALMSIRIETPTIVRKDP